MEDHANISRIIDLEDHVITDTQIVVFFNAAIREQLHLFTDKMPILHRFGKQG